MLGMEWEPQRERGGGQERSFSFDGSEHHLTKSLRARHARYAIYNSIGLGGDTKSLIDSTRLQHE